jgi:hypothetical protein
MITPISDNSASYSVAETSRGYCSVGIVETLKLRCGIKASDEVYEVQSLQTAVEYHCDGSQQGEVLYQCHYSPQITCETIEITNSGLLTVSANSTFSNDDSRNYEVVCETMNATNPVATTLQCRCSRSSSMSPISRRLRSSYSKVYSEQVSNSKVTNFTVAGVQSYVLTATNLTFIKSSSSSTAIFSVPPSLAPSPPADDSTSHIPTIQMPQTPGPATDAPSYNLFPAPLSRMPTTTPTISGTKDKIYSN